MNQSNHLSQPIGASLAHWTPPPAPAGRSLHGRYCKLERLCLDAHAKDLYDAYALDDSSNHWTYLAYGPFSHFDDYCQWLKVTCLSNDPLFYAIVDLTSSKTIGVASYLRIQPTHGTIEVGHLRFSALLQQKPAATEAMFLMMQHAFELGYRRYEWKCDALNQPSMRAAMRLGLSYEGIFRQAWVYNQRNRDTAWYAAIDSEWPALKQAFEQWLSPSNFDADGKQRTRLSQLTAPIRKRPPLEPSLG